MQHLNDIIKAFDDVVTWRDEHPETYAYRTEATRAYQSVHPLLTLSNLRALLGPDNIDSIDDFNPQKTALTNGDLCLYAGKTYKYVPIELSVYDSTVKPNANTFWVEYDHFSEWLKNKTNDSIQSFIESIFNNRYSSESTKSLDEYQYIFENIDDDTNDEMDPSLLYGFDINLPRDIHFGCAVHSIVFRYAEAATVNVHLINKLDNSIHASKIVSVAANYHSENLTDFIMSVYINRSFKGYDWSIVVDTGLASITYVNSGPSGENLRSLMSFSPFSVAKMGTPEISMTGAKKAVGSNFGMTLTYSTFCDGSISIVNKAVYMSEALMLYVGIRLLRELAFNALYTIDRQNFNISKADILYELDGDSASEKKAGLNYKLERLMKSISGNFMSKNYICFRCRQRGLKYTTA
jgi:hypothetical protein